MKRKLKKSTIILIVGCILGLSALLYPTFSDFWNNNFTTQAISSYVTQIEQVSQEDYRDIWTQAIRYNEQLLQRSGELSLSPELEKQYHDCLNVTGNGLMGYIEIPKINVTLPVYHTTSDEVLQLGVGHITWSSLPTGGPGTHCVLSGHRGLTSAKLFTDLDLLREGDTFKLNILNEVLTYEVDQIRTVEPHEIDDLLIEDGKDYCTLVTCTPYGVNTHRLLVRGHRVENAVAELNLVSEAVVVDQLMVASFLAIPILLALVLVVLFKQPESKKKKKRK